MMRKKNMFRKKGPRDFLKNKVWLEDIKNKRNALIAETEQELLLNSESGDATQNKNEVENLLNFETIEVIDNNDDENNLLNFEKEKVPKGKDIEQNLVISESTKTAKNKGKKSWSLGSKKTKVIKNKNIENTFLNPDTIDSTNDKVTEEEILVTEKTKTSKKKDIEDNFLIPEPIEVVKHESEEDNFQEKKPQQTGLKKHSLFSFGKKEKKVIELGEVNPTTQEEFTSESSVSTNSEVVEKVLNPELLQNKTNETAVEIRTNMVKVLENFYELKTTKSEASTYRIVGRLRLSLKELKKSIDEIKNKYHEIGQLLITGSFFSWDKFMDTLIENVYKDKYVKQEDRDRLREVALILSSETRLSIIDLDAHIRWLVYSIDPKLNIKEELAYLLSREENNFIWQRNKLEKEFNILEDLLEHTHSFKIEDLTRNINKTINQVKKISKGKKKLSNDDLEKVADIFDDVEISL